MREMRRSEQQLSRAECLEILEHRNHGVLALQGEDGYPYTVPINYFYTDGRLYFHSAAEGHKIDAIRNQEKASFCVIDKCAVVQEGFFTRYRSVVVFGKMHIIEDAAEKKAMITRFTDRLSPSVPEEKRASEVERGLVAVCMLCLEPEHITGKQSRDLAAHV
ncbi:MAG: pyridoxamine 5'-phosphate oxidase family protein [Lachnospiraceae bacterium]|nr:pyridoxamine 5'-phosphate oxidase family protein [Lachnospiraceae bacterium]